MEPPKISFLGAELNALTSFQKILPYLHSTGNSLCLMMENLIHLKKKCSCSRNLNNLFKNIYQIMKNWEDYFELGSSIARDNLLPPSVSESNVITIKLISSIHYLTKHIRHPVGACSDKVSMDTRKMHTMSAEAIQID